MLNTILKNIILILSEVIIITVMLVAFQAVEKNEKNVEYNACVENVLNEEEQTSVDLTIITMRMENGGEVTIELYPEVAINTVYYFITLVESEFYDSLIFHRVIPGFMIQGGDPEGNGMGGPGYSIKGEFSSNGFDNNLAHTRGVISMARSQHPDSAGSQFFIITDTASQLDGDYAAFGKVIAGMDVVDDIVES